VNFQTACARENQYFQRTSDSSRVHAHLKTFALYTRQWWMLFDRRARGRRKQAEGSGRNSPVPEEDAWQGGHGSDNFAHHTPSTRRADAPAWAQTLRGHLEDPWQAWYLLFVSILAVVTQIWLRIIDEGKISSPDPPAAHSASPEPTYVAVPPAAHDAARPSLQKVFPQVKGLFIRSFEKLVGGVGKVAKQAAEREVMPPQSQGCDANDSACLDGTHGLDFVEGVSYDQNTSLFYTGVFARVCVCL